MAGCWQIITEARIESADVILEQSPFHEYAMKARNAINMPFKKAQLRDGTTAVSASTMPPSISVTRNHDAIRFMKSRQL